MCRGMAKSISQVSMQTGRLPLLAQVQKSVELAEAHFGPLDVVIANAGMPSSSTPLDSLSSPRLQPMQQLLLVRGRGSIVFI